jgi:hypothetical protein
MGLSNECSAECGALAGWEATLKPNGRWWSRHGRHTSGYENCYLSDHQRGEAKSLLAPTIDRVIVIGQKFFNAATLPCTLGF